MTSGSTPDSVLTEVAIAVRWPGGLGEGWQWVAKYLGGDRGLAMRFRSSK